jgi:hypothetical protein
MQIANSHHQITSPYKHEWKVPPVDKPADAHNDEQPKPNVYIPQEHELTPENYSTEFLLSFQQVKVSVQYVIDKYTK